MTDLIQTIAIAALPVIFAITLHEAAHGYVARYFGDSTAWLAGRVSLNPLRHIDLWGTIVIPLVILLFSSGNFLFGYAKPVPVDFGRLRHPKRDMFWVAAAGPAANLVMALAWAALAKIAFIYPLSASTAFIAAMSAKGVIVNVSLMILNLLPLPPLDGGRITVSLLPMSAAMQFARLEPWGFPILIVLLFTHVLERILEPLVFITTSVIVGLFAFN